MTAFLVYMLAVALIWTAWILACLMDWVTGLQNDDEERGDEE